MSDKGIRDELAKLREHVGGAIRRSHSDRARFLIDMILMKKGNEWQESIGNLEIHAAQSSEKQYHLQSPNIFYK